METGGGAPGPQKTPVLSGLVLLILCFSLAACSQGRKGLNLAKQATLQMHSRYDAQQYAAIYDDTSSSFRQFTNEGDLTRFLIDARDRLGTVKEPTLKSEHISVHPGGRVTVTLVYDTDFERGSSRESLTWQTDDNGVALDSYRIDSLGHVGRP